MFAARSTSAGETWTGPGTDDPNASFPIEPFGHKDLRGGEGAGSSISLPTTANGSLCAPAPGRPCRRDVVYFSHNQFRGEMTGQANDSSSWGLRRSVRSRAVVSLSTSGGT